MQDDLTQPKGTTHKWKTGAAQPRGRNLLKLIELAGMLVKTLAGVAILISAALPFASGEATASTGSAQRDRTPAIGQVEPLTHVAYDLGNLRLFTL
jgi:hypothetical protein